MSVWFILWVLISAALIVFSVWTMVILYQQKKSWRLFARKNKLRYRSKALMLSPEIHGVYKGYSIGVFTSEHMMPDGRTDRKMTAIEVEMESRMPIGGAMGSKGMVAIIQKLDFSDTYQPDDERWDTENIIRCDDKKIIQAYLDDSRLAALLKLMEMKNAWMLFIFKGNDTILRIDTPDPLEGSGKLEKTIDMMIEVAQALELRKGEGKNLAAYKSQREARGARVDVDEKALENPSVFELEDEEGSDMSSGDHNSSEKE